MMKPRQRSKLGLRGHTQLPQLLNNMKTTKQESAVCLKLLIDEKVNRVVAAEANSDFVDILLSFLTIPMGTIIRLTSKTDAEKAPPLKIGCMNNLYHSFENLSPEIWNTRHCKTMVLKPRNPLSEYFTELLINVDDSGSEVLYECSRGGCKSKYENVLCNCGGMSRTCDTKDSTFASSSSEDWEPDGAFLKRERTMFIVSDNLQISPSSPAVLAQILSSLGSGEINLIKEMPVQVSKEQAVQLLARSLVSKSPLSDVFHDFLQLPNVGDLSLHSKPDKIVTSSSNGVVQKEEEETTHKLNVKVTVNKSTNSILFAEASNEFSDFLCTFMTMPIGSMLCLLKGNSGLGCMDDLYKSMAELDLKWFHCGAIKDDLFCPKIAQHHNCKKQPLKLSEQCESGSLINPRCSNNFLKEPSEFIISDDLEVKPLYSSSSFSILKELNVPINEIQQQQVVPISMKEALSLLKAALTSPSGALTDGLGCFLQKHKA
ncbi:unnamed protein product [Cuscuta europaea]|uniref:DUF674 family protein n=1 Tax=Cuscuta europaea TaxID=41803 RepID=A0A9P1EGD6_CUSEU|nr:unnamed protein product [Cuscuta europaea]